MVNVARLEAAAARVHRARADYREASEARKEAMDKLNACTAELMAAQDEFSKVAADEFGISGEKEDA